MLDYSFSHGFGLDWNHSKEKSRTLWQQNMQRKNIDDNRMEARFDAIRKERMFSMVKNPQFPKVRHSLFAEIANQNRPPIHGFVHDLVWIHPCEMFRPLMLRRAMKANAKQRTAKGWVSM